MKLRVYFFMLISFSTVLFAGELNFFREDLNFFLKDSVFTVDGNYYFKPLEGKEIKTMLYYPLPTGLNKGKIVSSAVYDLNSGKAVEISGVSEKGFFFQVTAAADSAGRYKIIYSQIFKSKSAEYILTTTNAWGRPLSEVNYTLTTDSAVVIDSFSFPPDRSLKLADKKVYSWQKFNFLPDKDFIIKWK